MNYEEAQEGQMSNAWEVNLDTVKYFTIPEIELEIGRLNNGKWIVTTRIDKLQCESCGNVLFHVIASALSKSVRRYINVDEYKAGAV